jgi:hypothetical protein
MSGRFTTPMTHTLLDSRRIASSANARFCADNAGVGKSVRSTPCRRVARGAEARSGRVACEMRRVGTLQTYPGLEVPNPLTVGGTAHARNGGARSDDAQWP